MNYLKLYLTAGRFNIEDVLPYLTNNKRDKKIYKIFGNEYHVKMNSLRYKTFAKSLKCARCHLVGSFFLLQKCITDPGNTYHFNLYAWDELKCKPIIMTKDHIIPASKGGKDHLSNMQTMCEICNRKKGSNE